MKISSTPFFKTSLSILLPPLLHFSLEKSDSLSFRENFENLPPPLTL